MDGCGLYRERLYSGEEEVDPKMDVVVVVVVW